MKVVGATNRPPKGLPPNPRQEPVARPPRPPDERVKSILYTRQTGESYTRKQLSTAITSCSPMSFPSVCVDEGRLRLRREGNPRESVPVLLVLPRPRRRRQEDRALHGARLRLGGATPDPPGDRGVRGPRECGTRGTHGGVATRARETVSVSPKWTLLHRSTEITFASVPPPSLQKRLWWPTLYAASPCSNGPAGPTTGVPRTC